MICFDFPFPTRRTLLPPLRWRVWFGLHTYERGVWWKLIIRSSGIWCHSCICLIYHWKCNLASFNRPRATVIFSVVAFRLHIFLPSSSITYMTLRPHWWLNEIQPQFLISRDRLLAIMKPLATLLVTSAVIGAPFKRKASTVEITFGISSSGNSDRRLRFLFLTLDGFLPLLFLVT